MQKTSTLEWKFAKDGGFITETGAILGERHMKDVCNYYGIPATLIAVDRKYGTHTLLDVLQSKKLVVGYNEVEGVVDIQDPRSVYVENKEFEEILGQFADLVKSDPKVTSNGLTMSAVWELPESTEEVFGDVFSRQLKVERLRQGGVACATALTRLACTNGMVVAEKGHNRVFRKGAIPKGVANEAVATTLSLSLNDLFKSLFYVKGQPVEASVYDVKEMKRCLTDITDSEVAASYFPMEEIGNVYQAQGIDIDKTPADLLKRLDSGFTYYEAFNILTNGAKMAEQSLQNHVTVAKFYRPSKMKLMKELQQTVERVPVFTENVKKRLMGDLVV